MSKSHLFPELKTQEELDADASHFFFFWCRSILTKFRKSLRSSW